MSWANRSCLAFRRTGIRLALTRASDARSQAQRERRVGQLRHSVTNGSGILHRIWIEPTQPAEIQNAVWRDRQFELHLLHRRPLSVTERGFLASYVGAVRRAPLACTKR